MQNESRVTVRTGGRHRRRFAVVAVTLLAAVGFSVGASSELLASSGSTTHTATAIHLTATELKQWRQETATPFQRAQLVEKMRAAFAGVAEVGVGTLPDGATVSGGAHSHEITAASTGATHVAHEVVAVGITGDHFWVTASYGDMARGAIWGAVQTCTYYYHVPGWLCSSAGSLLSSWSKGWGSANNHGVWAAVYWWPPHVSGGRW